MIMPHARPAWASPHEVNYEHQRLHALQDACGEVYRVGGRPVVRLCLVHSDVNRSNLRVTAGSSSHVQLSGLIDSVMRRRAMGCTTWAGC